jgi:hypothetical protein
MLFSIRFDAQTEVFLGPPPYKMFPVTLSF